MNLYLIFNIIIGACLASHACVIYDRYDLDLSFANSLRSKCSKCLTTLSMLDKLPIISYLKLHGKCRYCKNELPIHLLIIELIGAISFTDLKFTQQSLFEFLFRFFLLLIAIFDYYEKEFPTFFLAPLLIISLNQSNQNLINYIISVLPIAIIMIIFVYLRKVGSGDLFIYLILSINYGAIITNMIFLLACILFILIFLIERNGREVPFVPYIYTATILINLL